MKFFDHWPEHQIYKNFSSYLSSHDRAPLPTMPASPQVMANTPNSANRPSTHVFHQPQVRHFTVWESKGIAKSGQRWAQGRRWQYLFVNPIIVQQVGQGLQLNLSRQGWFQLPLSHIISPDHCWQPLCQCGQLLVMPSSCPPSLGIDTGCTWDLRTAQELQLPHFPISSLDIQRPQVALGIFKMVWVAKSHFSPSHSFALCSSGIKT